MVVVEHVQLDVRAAAGPGLHGGRIDGGVAASLKDEDRQGEISGLSRSISNLGSSIGTAGSTRTG